MKKTVVLFIMLLPLCCGVIASAVPPGAMVPLKVDNLEVETDTPVIRDWEPTSLRWLLRGPDGQVRHYVPANAQPQKQSGGLFSAKWLVTLDSGFIEIPAFADEGEWRLSCFFYDSLFGFQTFYTEVQVRTITVESGSIIDNLNAPIYIKYGGGPLGIGGFSMGTPDLIVIIGICIIIPIILLNTKEFLFSSRRKSNV